MLLQSLLLLQVLIPGADNLSSACWLSFSLICDLLSCEVPRLICSGISNRICTSRPGLAARFSLYLITQGKLYSAEGIWGPAELVRACHYDHIAGRPPRLISFRLFGAGGDLGWLIHYPVSHHLAGAGSSKAIWTSLCTGHPPFLPETCLHLCPSRQRERST